MWLLCRVKIPAVSLSKAFQRKSKQAFTRKDYIFVINSSTDIDDVDSEFLYAVQKFATMILQNMETRKHKADIKKDCLNSIKDWCDSWESYVQNRDEFFNGVCESIGACYLSANVYVGKLLQSANSIEYVLASQFSDMRGKVLHRHPTRGLSFRAVDTFSHVAVTKNDFSMCDSLHYFGAREAVEFPVVVVPLATFLDSPLGVLAADGLEDVTQDDDGNPNEVISFLFEIASLLSIPVNKFFVADISKRLADLESQCSSFDAADASLKDILLSVLPYSKDAAFVSFSPTPSAAQLLQNNISVFKRSTRAAMVYIMQVVEVKCLINFVTKPSIKIQWKNSVLITSECHMIDPSEHNDPVVCVVKIPEGMLHDDIDLRIFLYGTVDDKKRELSKRSITLQQMSNDGALLMDYNMECQYAPLPYVHAARLKFVGRLYSESDVVRIVFRHICCADLVRAATSSGLNSEESVDPYCVLRWKGIEVGRTVVVRNNSSPEWEELEFHIDPSYDDVQSEAKSFLLEVWDTDALDRASCLGLCSFSLDMLIKNISAEFTPLYCKGQQRGGVGYIRFVTDIIYASNMDEDIAVDALKIPFLSATIHDSGGADVEEGEDYPDLNLKIRRCELTIQSVNITSSVVVRNLLASVTGVVDLGKEGGSVVWPPRRNLKPYCVVFFNGAEVGRTGSAGQVPPPTILDNELEAERCVRVSEVCDCSSYCWDAETLVLDIATDVNIDNCRVVIELWVLDKNEKGVKIGNLTVKEKCFASLLCTSLKVCKWYDVRTDTHETHNCCGEMLISGRPLDEAGGGQATSPVRHPALTVGVEDVVVKHASVEEERKKHMLKIKWNESILLACDLSNVKSEQTCDISCCVNFMNPNDVSVHNSSLRFEIFELSRRKPVACAVLSGESLVQLMGQPLQRTRWVELSHDRSTCSEDSSSTTAKIQVRGGSAGTGVLSKQDGRKIGLDVLGAAGLLAPTYHMLRRPNAYCKVFWNDKHVGQTAVAWNSTDPLWKSHRYLMSIPQLDISEGSLGSCLLKIEVWAVFSLSDRKEELLGCVDVPGAVLMPMFMAQHASLNWFPIEMSSNYPLEKQEYVCSKKGAVKLRIFHEGCTLDDSDAIEGGGEEYLIQIHEAMGLAEIDHFTKTNATVIVYWNNAEIGRTAVVPAETHPVWDGEVFLVRAARGQTLAQQSLQVHVYDTTGGVTGDFLGCIEVATDRVVEFFSSKLANVHGFELKKSIDMDDSDNRHVAGTLFLSAEVVEIQPVEAPVVLYSKATLFVRGALNLPCTNVFQNSSDAMCILYWSSHFDQQFDLEIGRSKVFWKSLNPTWKKEKFIVNVPVVEEWSSVSLRIELRDVAGFNDSTFLGSLVLSGSSLKSLLSRSEEFSSVLVQYSLSNTSPLILPEFSPYVVEKPGEENSGFLVLAGGAGGGLDMDLDDESGNSRDDSSAISATDSKGGEVGTGLFGGLKKSLSVLSMKERLKKRETKNLEFRFHEIHGLCLPDSVLLETVGTAVSSQLFVLVAINNEPEMQIGFVKGNETLTKFLKVKFNSDPLIATFSRPQDEDLATCSAQFDLWLQHSGGSLRENSSITLSGSKGSPLPGPDDLFLGSVLLQGQDIVGLMRPKAPSKSFLLRDKKNVDLSQNKFFEGSSIVVSGLMPNLLRQLSGVSAGNGTIRRAPSTGNSTFRRSASVSGRLDMAGVEDDELTTEEKIEIHICEATGMFKSTSLLGSLHEYRADIYWNDELKFTTQYVKATSSASMSAAVDVIWGNEYFIVTKDKGEVLLDCKLTIEVRSKSAFWGAVSFEGEKLLDFIEAVEPEPFDLGNLPHKEANDQKHMQGLLYLEGKILPKSTSNVDETASASTDLREYDTSKPLPEGMKDLNFYVLAASDLGQADKFGKSDPFCIVKWNGIEIGKTDVKKKTLNPVWEAGKFVLRTYSNLGSTDGENKNLIKSCTPFNSLKLGLAEGIPLQASRRRQVVSISAMTKVTFQPRTHCVLEVEVWDWNAMGNSVFLGACVLKGPSLAHFFDCKHMTRNWYKLEKNKNMSRSANKLVRGSIELSVGPAHVVAADEANAEPFRFEVEIISAKNLSKVDQYSQADPYCIVRWNNDLHGKTRVLKNTLAPEWENEVFGVSLASRSLVSEGYLLIEVWDFDAGVQHKFMGCALIRGTKLLRLIDKGDVQWINLRKSDFLTQALQNVDVSGSVRIKVTPADPNKKKTVEIKTTSFEFTAVGAENLSNSSFFGNVDSFCILKINGREIGTSATIAGSSNPTWNEKFPLVLDTYTSQAGDECSDDSVCVEVWSSLALARGDCLGAVYLTLADLLDLCRACKSVKEIDRMKATFELLPASALHGGGGGGGDEEAQPRTRGTVRLHARHFGAADLHQLSTAAAAETLVQWPVHAPLLPGTTHGLPSFELSVLNITDLVVPAKGGWAAAALPDPFCIVFFNGQELGATPVCTHTLNPVWNNPEPISIKIPENVESESFWVTIKVYNMQSLDRGEFLGQVSFSFWSLFCLHYGTFTLPLRPELSNITQFLKAKITFSVDIYSPLWDSVKSFSPPGIQRTVTVLRAQGLPRVNDALPSTKCIVFYDGGIKVRSPLVLASMQPAWSPVPALSVQLDYRDPKDIIIQIVFVDVKEKREFCLGEVAIPFQFILRPPAEPMELWLTEPRKVAPKEYKFLLDGSLIVHIASSKDVCAWNPWSCRQSRPLACYSVEELAISSVARKSKVVSAPTFVPEELRWIGSAGCFTAPSIISARPDILLVPLKGMGAMVDGRCVGNDPQKQYALAVKRSPEKLSLSDPLMVQESFFAIQRSVIHLRRKELYAHIRNVTQSKLHNYFENMIRKNRFDMSAIFKRVSSAISICFPGTVSFFALLSKDSKSMRYTLFEKSFENEEAPSFFTLWEGEGVEWNCVGRHAGQGSTVSIKDLDTATAIKCRLIAFSRLRQFCPPRLCAPLVCGDVSLGVVGIENFDTYRGGTDSKFADLGSVQNWLDKVGNLCGKVLYTGRENNVLKLLESYALLSTSTVGGLLKVLLENCLQVLQGCRLMEIWSLHDRSLTSLATSWPESVSAPTKWIVIQYIKVVFTKAATIKSDIRSVGKKIGNFLFGSRGNGKVEKLDVNTTSSDDEATASSSQSPQASLKSVGFVLGIYYNGFEQYQFAEYFTKSQKKVEDFEHCFNDVKIFLSSDRDIWLTLYSIDENMMILEQWSGKFQIVNFKEKNISAVLSSDAKERGEFCFSSSLLWPSAVSVAMQRAVELKAMEEVRVFPLTVHRARDLQKTDLLGSADPFCEVYWCDNLVGKTRVLKDCLEPVWEESFELVPDSQGGATAGHAVSCRLEVWDMDFLGKGSFLGECSLPLDQLLQPPLADIEVTLGPKSCFSKAENKHVGGTVLLSHSIVKKNQDNADLDNAETAAETESESEHSEDEQSGTPAIYQLSKVEKQIASRLVDIEDPVLKLCVGRAADLAKADLLGLASAYVKVYRLSADDFRAAARHTSLRDTDPVAVTRVIEKSLNPSWNDDLVLGLSVQASTDKTTQSGLLDKWPIFVLEVWSKVKVGDGAFLGMVSLTPLQYALKKTFSGDLAPSPFLDSKGNKRVQGSIVLGFSVEGGGDARSSAPSFTFSPSNHLLPTTHVTITIVSAKVDEVIKGGLRKKTVNPFCTVRWGEVKVGETAIKSNSVEPSWANEQISLDLSQALMRPEWLPVMVQVWNKQAEDSVLIGEVEISLVELLHPSSGQLLKRSLIRGRSGDDRDSATKNISKVKLKDEEVKSSVVFRLSVHRRPQKIVPKLKYMHSLPLELKNFDKNKSDPILKHYSQESPRVLLTSPVKLEVIRDTQEEIRRQKHENIKLSNIIKQIEDLNSKYNSAIFDQVGLISEVHYGQALSAFKREAPTVLRFGECDCFLLPTIVKRTRGASASALQADKGEGTTVQVHAAVSKKKKKIDVGEGELCLVSRYAKDCIPQRDVEFLKKMRDIISKSILLFEERQIRRVERRGMLQKLKAICADIHRYSPADVIMTSANDVSDHFGCAVDVYLLRRAQSSYSLVRCSTESGVFEIQKNGEFETSEFVSKCAKLSRHGLLLQFYRGQTSVASSTWKSGFSEAALAPLLAMRDDMRAVESRHLAGEVMSLSRKHAPMGACLVPLLTEDECFLGMLVISGTDKISHAVYRLLRNETEQESSSKHVEDSTDDNDNIVTRHLFEEGTTECMRDLGLQLGKALFSATCVAALRELKTFPLREGADPQDIVRYCFRKLLESIPMICEISLWRVLIVPEEHLGDVYSAVLAGERESLVVSGLFKTPHLTTLLSTPDEKSVYQSYHPSSQKKDSSETKKPIESNFLAAKTIYLSSAPWVVALPTTSDLTSMTPVTCEDADVSGGGESDDSFSDKSCSESDSSRDGTSSQETKPPAGLKNSKSIFGGIFTNSVKETREHAESPEPAPLAAASSSGSSSRATVHNDVMQAHAEINTCVSNLNQTSFHINSFGGVYLSMISSSSAEEDIIAEVIGKQFDGKCSRFRSDGLSDDSVTISPKLAARDMKQKRRLIVPGTRGVRSHEKLIHVTEAESAPSSLEKAPLPNESHHKKGKKSEILEERQEGIGGEKNQKGKNTRHNASKQSGGVDRKSSPVAAKTSGVVTVTAPKYMYFLAVRAPGLGGDNGWGSLGVETCRAVDDFAGSMADLLAKHATLTASLDLKKEKK